MCRLTGPLLWFALCEEPQRGAGADRRALQDRRQYPRFDPEDRRAVRQDLSLPLVDAFFSWLAAQAQRGSRKFDLGKALANMLTRQNGFRLFLDDGHIDIDSNRVENAIRRPPMNRRNALFAGHDEGGRDWARFASLIGTCEMNGVEPYAYLCDHFTRLANGHLAKDIDALMPWAYAARIKASQ